MFLLSFSLLVFVGGCSSRGHDPNNPDSAFIVARQSYDDKDYELAINKLGGFRSRFPYSKLATTAELLIADSYFALGRYAESLVAYQRFSHLHPKHPKRAYALFQVGQSHWVEAPEEIDREQDYTRKAVAAWQTLIATYPRSTEAEKARKLVEEGERRMAGSFAFIADFYCAQKIYHACAFRHIKLAEAFARFQELAASSRHKAADALGKVLARKKNAPQKNTNIYLKNYTVAELSAYIATLRQKK